MMQFRTVAPLLIAWGLTIGFHVALGWVWTVAGGVLMGLWDPQHGWRLGMGGGLLGWGTLVGYTAIVAPASLQILLDTLGALGGNIPGEVVVGASVVLGGGLGAVGGAIGTACRSVWASRYSATR